MPGSAVLAALLAAASVAALLSSRSDGRLRTALPPPRGAPVPRGGRLPPATTACLVLGLSLALLLGLRVGLALGAVVAVGGPRALARLEPRSVRDDRERLLRDLPLVLDLLASCLAGGAPLARAADAVARAVGGPAGGRLGAVGSALAVGAPAGEAWRLLAGTDPAGRDADPLAPAARALSRAADGGAPVADAVSRLAGDARADARSRAEQAARRVGVLAVAPLGLCFLPAFVLVGVVPVVVGLAGPLLASL